MSPILYFWEMSGFEPRELPWQAGTLPTLAIHLPVVLLGCVKGFLFKNTLQSHRGLSLNVHQNVIPLLEEVAEISFKLTDSDVHAY
jgi:hypothetical protein